jgi:hypothetical protein
MREPTKLLIINLTKYDEDNIKITLRNFVKKNVDFEMPHENKQIYTILANNQLQLEMDDAEDKPVPIR